MDSSSKIAIVILSWNGYQDTVECLESLAGQTYKNFQIVLVDNASRDNEGQRLKEKFPAIHLIQNSVNRGFAGGNNDGMNWAFENGFDYIVNLNNDCIATPDWLEKLVNGLAASGADFASSMIVYYPETERICSDGDALLADGTGIVPNHLRARPRNAAIRPIFSACGAGSIYSRKCLEAVRIKENQYFDEMYFAYFEDVELGIRLKMKSFRGVVVPDAVVYHKKGQTSVAGSPFEIFQCERNRLLTILLTFPLLLVLPAEILYFFKKAIECIAPFFHAKKERETFRVCSHCSRKEWGWLVLKAHKWVAGHLGEIWENRRERKRKGMVGFRICRYFYWDVKRIFAIGPPPALVEDRCSRT